MTAPNVSSEEPLVSKAGQQPQMENHTNGGRHEDPASKQKVKMNVICHVENGFNGKHEPKYEPQIPEVLKGSVKPLAVSHCCTRLSPPELSFDPGSGTLENEKGQKTKIEGSLKVLGYLAQEIINAKQG